MRRTAVAAALLTAALATAASPAVADPISDLLSAGSSSLGSSDNSAPQHFGKLGRPDATNGVKSINTWVYAPGVTAVGTATYPTGSRIGVRWNSTIDAGPVVDGNQCDMSIVLSGPKVPAKAKVTKTQDCTATQIYTLRAPGSYRISVSDAISGAANTITFTLK